MLYSLPNTSATLMTDIKNLLLSDLGTFKNGAIAAWVEPPQSPVSGSGIHLFIGRYPTQVNAFTYRWNVNLFIYGDIDDVVLMKFDNAINRMRSRYSVRTEAIMPYREGMLPQAFFGLLFDRFAYPEYY